MHIPCLLLTALCTQSVLSMGFSLAKLRQRGRESRRAAMLSRRGDTDATLLYPEYNLTVPIDHFPHDSQYYPSSNGTFNLRYWFDASYYKPGGPVFVLCGGETDATGRLVYLQKGIVHQVIKATGGIGVILEHRYYGESQPFDDLSVHHLRFLTTDQAIADTAYFAQNVVFKGLENHSLTSHTTPYIAYGGSYAGAFVAILRKQYPDVYFGAISSSGVTQAIYDYWMYYRPIAEFGPPQCIQSTANLTNAMDNILIKPENKAMIPVLKEAFELQNITYNDDFISTLGVYGIGEWQGKNWDPEVNDPSLSNYCGNISSDTLLYPRLESKRSTINQLLTAGGYGHPAQLKTLGTRMLNWIGNAAINIVEPCASDDQTQDQCYGTHNATEYHQDGLDRVDYRSWPYQYCSQWGFYQTGSGVPADQLPLMSRLVTLEYLTIICRDTFNITSPPNVALTNVYGGYNISYNRLAIVDGQWDPWREATPHATLAPARNSTASEPFYEIPRSVHHWDENGLFANETTDVLPPPRIKRVQALEVQWVQGWLKEAAQHAETKRQQELI